MHKENLAQAFREYEGQIDGEIGPGPSSPIRTVSGSSRSLETLPQTTALEITDEPSKLESPLPGETKEEKERCAEGENSSTTKEIMHQKSDGADNAEVEITKSPNEIHEMELGIGTQEPTPSVVPLSINREDVKAICTEVDEAGSTQGLTKELDDKESTSKEDVPVVDSSDLAPDVELSLQSENVEPQEKINCTEESSEVESIQLECADISDTLNVPSSIISPHTTPHDRAIEEDPKSMPVEKLASWAVTEVEGAGAPNTHNSHDTADHKNSTPDVQCSDKKIAKLDVSSIASDTENLELKSSSNGELDQPLKTLPEVITFITLWAPVEHILFVIACF